MPFEAKVRPVDLNSNSNLNPRSELEPVKTVAKSRFKRIFEKQFTRVSSLEKVGCNEDQVSKKKVEIDDFEPGSVSLAKMVRNFMEDIPEKPRCRRSWCNCANGDCIDSSDDEFDSCSCFLSSSCEARENVKGLVPCVSVIERNLLADTARIVHQNKGRKRKDDVFLKIVTDELSALGYDAAICNSRWEKSSACPAGNIQFSLGNLLADTATTVNQNNNCCLHAGEYKYVDVITEGGDRLIIDIDFRSEFEIARPTKKYRNILQTLPVIFVGKSNRLQRIISVVSDAAKQSLKKRSMPFPPWRKAEYVKSKWLSPYGRTTPDGIEAPELANPMNNTPGDMKLEEQLMVSEPRLSFGEKSCSIVFDKVEDNGLLDNNVDKNVKILVEAHTEHQVAELKRSSGAKITGGLACIIEDEC